MTGPAGAAGAPHGPSSAATRLATQTGMELRLTARRGENVLVTIVIPVIVLVFFSSLSILPTGATSPVDFLLPGAMALAIIATSLVNLGIATAYERHYGVLKRLGGSPLTRSGLLSAKMLAVLVVEVAQIVLLVAVAAGILGWRPAPNTSIILVAIGLLLGTAAFAGLGLFLAGALRAEATLAIANGLFLGFLLLGGIILPISHLPPALESLASVLPASALADTFRVALGQSGDATGPIMVLIAWGVGAVVLAARTFRWE